MSHARSATDDEALAQAMQNLQINSEESMEEGSDDAYVDFDIIFTHNIDVSDFNWPQHTE